MSHSSGEYRSYRDVWRSRREAAAESKVEMPSAELPLPRILTLRWPNGILRFIGVLSLAGLVYATANPDNYSRWACLGIGALAVLGILFILLQLFVYMINSGY